MKPRLVATGSLILLAALLSLAPAGDNQPPIIDKPIVWNAERDRLTLDYIHQHYSDTIDPIEIVPRIVVIHWTASPSLSGSFNTMNPVRLQGRDDIAKASPLNVSAHFLVDRDGTIYRLMPETYMARHCIGLNLSAIGVENVGGGKDHPLTDKQLAANAALVRYLKGKYNTIEHLIGHFEYGAFKGTPLWREKDPKYFTRKVDPGPEFMAKLRELVKDLGLKGPP
jgi:N-acetylmuramoyl-L-alanine amidase